MGVTTMRIPARADRPKPKPPRPGVNPQTGAEGDGSPVENPSG